MAIVLTVVTGPAAHATNEPELLPGTGFVQATWYDRTGSDSITDAADPQGIVRTPWEYQEQSSGLGVPSMDTTTARQKLRFAGGTAVGDVRIRRTFFAKRNQRYTGTATVQFSNVTNPALFKGRLVIVGIDSGGSQVGGTAAECNTQIQPGDVDPASQEIPVQVLEVVNCQMPDDPAVHRVRFTIGIRNFSDVNGNRGSGTMTIHEVSFQRLT